MFCSTESQYIGDGNAVYPISGLPELDEESILTIFDVPEKQREAVVLHYLGGLTAKEIAERTSAPLPTVKSRLKSARRALAEYLRED